MEPPHPERPGMELLETDDEPGRLERFATAALQRRGVRVAGAVALALVVGLGVSRGLDDEAEPPAGPSAAEEIGARPDGGQGQPPRDPKTYLPPPWVVSERVDWQVLGALEVDLESPVYVVSFVAVNRSSELRTPNLKAVGQFEGRPGFRFTASCTGFAREDNGEPRPLRTSVQPYEKVFMRCIDTMEYSSNRPDLDPDTLEIRGFPYDGLGRGPTVLYGVPGTNASDSTRPAQEAPLVRVAARLEG